MVENLFSGSQFPSHKKTLSEFEKKELKTLITQRFKLDEYFDCTKTSLKSSERLTSLRYLQKYLKLDFKNREYDFEDVLHIHLQSSKQNKVVLNVAITKINQLLSTTHKELSLLFENNHSWFGFFRNICLNIG